MKPFLTRSHKEHEDGERSYLTQSHEEREDDTMRRMDLLLEL